MLVNMWLTTQVQSLRLAREQVAKVWGNPLPPPWNPSVAESLRLLDRRPGLGMDVRLRHDHAQRVGWRRFGTMRQGLASRPCLRWEESLVKHVGPEKWHAAQDGRHRAHPDALGTWGRRTGAPQGPQRCTRLPPDFCRAAANVGVAIREAGDVLVSSSSRVECETNGPNVCMCSGKKNYAHSRFPPRTKNLSCVCTMALAQGASTALAENSFFLNTSPTHGGVIDMTSLPHFSFGWASVYVSMSVIRGARPQSW